MVSFLNVHLPVLLQMNKVKGGTLLPWPNGSLLTGKLMPIADATGVLLVLGQYRVRIEVPPNTPMGQVWIELLQREYPGKFRLLSNRQAVLMLMEMLQKHGRKLDGLAQEQAQTTNESSSHAQAIAPKAQDWARLPIDQLPFATRIHDDRLTLVDSQHGQTRGMLHQKQDSAGFILHGRLDLDALGAMAFALEGKEGQAWRITLHTQNNDLKLEIERAFAAWLAEMQVDYAQPLLGTVHDFMPEALGAGNNFKA